MRVAVASRASRGCSPCAEVLSPRAAKDPPKTARAQIVFPGRGGPVRPAPIVAPTGRQAAGCSPVCFGGACTSVRAAAPGLHCRLTGGARASGCAGRGAGADGGAASGDGVDAELAADGGDPVGHVGQPGSGAGAGAGEAGAVVGDLAGQPAGVVAQGDDDAGAVPSVLGGVVQRLQAAEVDRCFDRGRVAGGAAGVDGDRSPAAGGRGGERGRQAEVGQRRGIDAVGQAAQAGGYPPATRTPVPGVTP